MSAAPPGGGRVLASGAAPGAGDPGPGAPPGAEPADAPRLRALAPDLWVVDVPLPLVVGDVGARMTVLRIRAPGRGPEGAGAAAEQGDLLLHSPVAIDEALAREIEALGRVRWLVAPNKVHHLFFAAAVERWPGAERWAAPGLAAKRRRIPFQHVLGEDPPPEPWRGAVRLQHVGGMPVLEEVVFLHEPSRTLILTDLAFHVAEGAPNRARLFHWLMGVTGRFGPSRLVRLLMRDRAAVRASLREMLAWDFERVIVSHGAVVERDGRERLAEAFRFLGVEPPP